MSISTYKNCRRWWERAGYVAIVRPGWTPDLSPGVLRSPGARNTSQAYVLCVPRSRSFTKSSPERTCPLSRSCKDLDIVPPREREIAPAHANGNVGGNRATSGERDNAATSGNASFAPDEQTCDVRFQSGRITCLNADTCQNVHYRRCTFRYQSDTDCNHAGPNGRAEAGQALASHHAVNEFPYEIAARKFLTTRANGDSQDTRVVMERPAELRRGPLAGLTDGWWKHITRPFVAAGWTVRDLVHAVDHHPDGRQHRTRLENIRHPAGWLRWRLSLWLDPRGNPLLSPSQQRALGSQERTGLDPVLKARSRELSRFYGRESVTPAPQAAWVPPMRLQVRQVRLDGWVARVKPSASITGPSKRDLPDWWDAAVTRAAEAVREAEGDG